jgi:hypothetical protein
VVDAKHDDLASFVVDSIQDSIGASASTEDARQLVAQLTTDPMRILDEHAGDELDDGGTYRFGQLLGDRPSRRPGND